MREVRKLSKLIQKKSNSGNACIIMNAAKIINNET